MAALRRVEEARRRECGGAGLRRREVAAWLRSGTQPAELEHDEAADLRQTAADLRQAAALT